MGRSFSLLYATSIGAPVRHMAPAVALSDAAQVHIHLRPALLHAVTRSLSTDGDGPLLWHVPVRGRKAFRYRVPAKLGSDWRRKQSVEIPGHQQEVSAVHCHVYRPISRHYNGDIFDRRLYANGAVFCVWLIGTKRGAIYGNLRAVRGST